MTHSDENRKLWITDLENEAKRNPTIALGFSDEEMKKNWTNF